MKVLGLVVGEVYYQAKRAEKYNSQLWAPKPSYYQVCIHSEGSHGLSQCGSNQVWLTRNTTYKNIGDIDACTDLKMLKIQEHISFSVQQVSLHLGMEVNQFLVLQLLITFINKTRNILAKISDSTIYKSLLPEARSLAVKELSCKSELSESS